MANISREEDLRDLAERQKYGRRLHGSTYKSPTQMMQDSQDRADRAFAELKSFVRHNIKS